MAKFGNDKWTDKLRSFIHDSNLKLILLCLIASAYGCTLVYSAAHGFGEGLSGSIIQIGASIGGLLLAIFISRFEYETICALWPLWSAVALIMVILTFTPLGLNAAGPDDTAWLAIGPITFQPAELLKISFIISFSMHLSRVQDRIHEFRTLFFLCLQPR